MQNNSKEIKLKNEKLKCSYTHRQIFSYKQKILSQDIYSFIEGRNYYLIQAKNS